jgi:hypothetical protein
LQTAKQYELTCLAIPLKLDLSSPTFPQPGGITKYLTSEGGSYGLGSGRNYVTGPQDWELNNNNIEIFEGVSFGQNALKLWQDSPAKCRTPTAKLTVLFNSQSLVFKEEGTKRVRSANS